MRRWWLPILLVLLMPALPALAGEAGAAKPGLMDVDPASAIVAIAVFVVLLVVLGKFAWGPILKGLKEREDTIRKAVDDAKAASDRAQAVVQEYEARMAHAAEEAKAILEEAKRDAQALKAQIEASARSEAEAAKQRAVKEIDQARLAAWDTLVRDAAQLATEAASRIVHKSLDAAGHERLVAEVVGQVQASRAGKGS
ncbi:MAG: F0F1 ATP synthase subunit B [Planctomycetia bacterium]